MALFDFLRAKPVKATQGGIAGAWITSGNPMMSSLNNSPQKIMATAQVLYRTNVHIRAAERVIDQRFATVPWHLEDENDDEITDESPPNLLAVRQLIERPYTPQKGDPVTSTPKTRSQLWAITARHMGLCGMSFWYPNQTEALAGTPLEILYINPARMTAAEDKQGNRVGWVMDADARGGGVPFTNDEVIPFYLEHPDSGHYGVGLVETVYQRANLMKLLDQHVQGVMSAGGRLAGIMSPVAGETIPDEQFQQLVRDIRTISEAPDAAKRMLVLKGPIEFTTTASTMSELQVIDLDAMVREDILETWGVPQSQLGIPSPSGLNSGAKQGFDEAVLWQNGVGPRLRSFVETVQYEFLDRYKGLGMTIDLEVDEPTFDDRLPQFDLADKALNLPLTNMERRELIGLAPFGNPSLDYAVWMPLQITELAMAPDEKGNPVESAIPPKPAPVIVPPVPPPADVNALPPGKAKLPPGLGKMRDKLTTAMQRDVQKVLDEMRAEVARKVTANAGHLAKRPKDLDAVFNEARWERALEQAMRPHVAAIGEATLTRVNAVLPAKAGLSDSLLARLFKRVGVRIKEITQTTRDTLALAIQHGIEQGLGAAELGQLIGESTAFGPARAELIARTETASVLNTAALDQYREFGVTRVQAYDGDDDETCAERDGQIFDIDEAELIEDHPNGTLDWAPVVGTA